MKQDDAVSLADLVKEGPAETPGQLMDLRAVEVLAGCQAW